MSLKGVNNPAQSFLSEVLPRNVFKVICKAVTLLGNNGVQNNIRVRKILLAATHAELKLVTSKRKGAGTVSVRVVPKNCRKCWYAQIHTSALCTVDVGTCDEVINNYRKRGTQEDGNNCRWSLICAKAVIVSSRCNRHAEKVCM